MGEHMRRLVLALCLVWASGFSGSCLMAQIDLESLSKRAEVRHSNVPRRVLAFYYPWYGNPNAKHGSGRWSHWSGVEEDKQRIATSTNFPSLGAYDSHDPEIIAQHCAWAKEIGIDGFIISWWGKGSFEDQAMQRVLDGCHEAGLVATIYYERVPDQKTGQSAANDILALLDRYAAHPAWLSVAGRPVVFVYVRAVADIGLQGWLDAVSLINDGHPGGAIVLGDQPDRAAARVFDGIHTYNTAGSLRNRDLPQVASWVKDAYRNWVDAADAFGRISTITVIPGYDDTRIRKPGLCVERMDGASYRAQWEAAIDADPHWVLITSWNEWHEGSDIEPSVEYGDAYLKLTAEFTARFKAKGQRKERPSARKAVQISDDEKAQLRKRLRGIRVGLLPNAELSTVWPLLDIGVRPASLSWEQVAGFQRSTVKEIPVIIYASDEGYRQTVNRAGDVDEAIRRYLSGGGCLVVLPAGPTPFYCNELGQAVNSCSKFGLPISVGGERGGWEQPPEGKELSFAQSGSRLPHLANRFPFPNTGDLRWRPFDRDGLADEDDVLPLLGLYDKQDTHYGDAVMFVHYRTGELKGGKVLYAWFGLLQSPQVDRLFYDVFRLVAEQIDARS